MQKKIKKVDLLQFQKSLNSQFMSIFEEKQNQKNKGLEEQSSGELGLETLIDEVLFFIPLTDLKNISMDNRYESIIKTKSWFIGFNQLNGEIFSIVDLSKILDFIILNQYDFNKNDISNNSRIIYLKEDKNNAKNIALNLNNFKLNYTVEYVKCYEFNVEGNNDFYWKRYEENSVFKYLKKEKLNKYTLELIATIDNMIDNDLKFNLDTINLTQLNKDFTNIVYFIKDIYVDIFTEKIILVLNTKMLLNFLSKIEPY